MFRLIETNFNDTGARFFEELRRNDMSSRGAKTGIATMGGATDLAVVGKAFSWIIAFHVVSHLSFARAVPTLKRCSEAAVDGVTLQFVSCSCSPAEQ